MMSLKRRTFLKGCVGTGAIVVMSPFPACKSIVTTNNDSDWLEELFRSPPDSAKARTWWHWVNGNVSETGITRDLEAMKQAGLGGFQLFQVSGSMPKGPLDFGSDEHTRLLKFVAAEAQRLGLEFEMHNCPGWTSSGGPWITPELSMQQVVWTETFATGGERIELDLARPFAKRNYYRDSYVLAFPSLQGEEQPMADLLRNLTSSAGPVDPLLLDHSDMEKGVNLTPTDDNTPGYLLLEFAQPFTARSVSLYSKAIRQGGGAPAGNEPNCLLEVSDNGQDFRQVYDFVTGRLVIDDSETDCPVVANFAAVTARFFRLSVRSPLQIIDLKLAAAKRIPQWTGKANYKSETGKIIPGVTSGTKLPDDPFPVDDGMVIRPESVIDLSSRMDSNGRLTWDAPAGNWTILRMGSTTVGIENHPATEGGAGLECDKFSKQAIEFHFDQFFGQLLPTLEAFAKTGEVGALIDSYEIGFQNWTAEFPAEFRQRMGYELAPYLATMTGRIVNSVDLSERFLWDVRRTQADLMADYYYGHFTELCHQHCMISYVEPYSGGPFEEMQAGSRFDVPMGEFWSAGSQSLLDAINLKLVSSVAHVNGKAIVAAESFTGQPNNSKWQEYPFGLKAHGDWIYSLGVNRFIFHRFAHQPHPDAAPGMTMGSVGSHFDRTNTWYDRAQSWFTYLARSQAMLQQGLYVADLAYFIGEDAPLINPARDELKPTLPESCAYDTVNTEALLNRMSIVNGRILLPDGMSYRMLLLKDQDSMTLPVLKKISSLVAQGMVLIGPKPNRTPGLAGYPATDEELTTLANQIWGEPDNQVNIDRNYGQGRVFWGLSFEEIYQRLSLPVDFSYSSASGDAAIHYLHRQTEDADIYFVSNHKRRSEQLVCSFRTAGRQPELWNPVTGEIFTALLFEQENGLTRLPIQLGPTESAFVVFTKSVSQPAFLSLTRNGIPLASCTDFETPTAGRYSDVMDNFSLSLWLKPEVDLSGGFGNTNMAIYPPSGPQVYGAGHVTCGLAAGRSDVFVYERGDSLTPVLSVKRPLSGWTHLALVYQDGIPSLYLDGELAATGKASGNRVHPGLNEALLSDGALYFQGDMTEPLLSRSILSAGDILAQARAGIPAPESPPAVEHEGSSARRLLFWQNGNYQLAAKSNTTKDITIAGLSQTQTINGPWSVDFPARSGTPSRIDLPQLISLHKHADSGVKYFSGTATYRNSFNLASVPSGEDQRLFLDLGRVEVIARVILNGSELGIFWCPPFRTDITNLVRSGQNELTIEVTNLWPNRLIGDEQLPAENEYSNGQIQAFPDWYLQGAPKPAGGRITFAATKTYDKDSPLLASGLLGPVVIRQAISRLV